MALAYKSTLPLSGIAVPIFALFLSVGLELLLQLQALISLSLSLGITLVLPTIEIALAITLQLIAQFTIAIGFGLPSFNLNLSVAFSFELALVLGFVATLQLLLGLGNVSLIAYGWFGPGQAFGGALTGAVGGGWPDGTPSSQSITAYLLVATASGSQTPDQVASIALLPAPTPPPTPTNPPPPAGTPFPPPQAYEAGLASVTIAPPPVGGTQATATVSVDNSIATGIGAITAINVTNHGSGYTSAPMVTITDSAPIVSASSATPVVLTLLNPLSIPVGEGFGVTIAGVEGSTIITAATAAAPIVVTMADATGLVTAAVPQGSYGLDGLSGQWYAKVTSSTTAELWSDPGFSIPSSGSGTYTPSSAKLAGNVCGLHCAKVLSPTTVALYADPGFTVPVAGFGAYTGGTGTATGGGSGAGATCTMGGGAQNALKSLLNGIAWPAAEGLAGGVITFLSLMPALFSLMLALLGNLQARAALLAGASAGVSISPPSVSVSLQWLAKIEATLRANLTATLPSLSAKASAALNAQINAIASITAQIGFFLGLAPLELEIWEYTGPGSGLGAAVAAGPGTAGWHDATAPGVPVVAGVIGITNPAAAAAFGTFFSGI